MLKILSFFLSLLIFLPSCTRMGVFERSSRLPLTQKTIAVLPFENFSGEKGAVEMVMPYVHRWFEEAGLEIEAETVVERFLLQHEIRSTGHLSETTMESIKNELDVKYILLGNVILLSDDPVLSVSARLVSIPEGNVVWGGHASRSGEEFKTVLGLGKIKTLKELTPIIMDELFSSLKHFGPADSQGRKKECFRVAVMPFENFSNRKDAGIIATHLFLAYIAQKPGWEAVEYGKVWSTLVSENYPYRGKLDYDTLQVLGKKLGVDGILLGTVEKYRERFGTQGEVIPEIAISLRLLYVPDKTIIWADRLTASGEDHIAILDWGEVITADRVAQKVIQKLVKHLPYKTLR